MTSKSPLKKIEPNRSLNFSKVAENFYEGAKIASEYSYYNAAGVLIVHAAIAYSDAISIKYKGVKVHGENHYEIISLLTGLIPYSEEKKKALNNLKSIIDHKNKVSYSGDIYHKKDIETLWKHFERFRIWAERILK
jgi:hypothetical protein